MFRKRLIKWPEKILSSKAFIKYLNDKDDIYENIDEHSPNLKHNTLILFDDMIADMLSNKKRQPIVTQLFTREN